MTFTEVEKLTQEARELLLIPNIGKALSHKISELKAMVARNIDYYRPTRESQTQKQPHPLEGTRFKITRFGDYLWIPSLPENPYNDAYHVIPQPIIDYITGMDIETGIINMQSGLKFPGLKGRVFNLSFEKHSDKCITGIINEIKDIDSNSLSPDLFVDIDMHLLDKGLKKDEVIRLLLQYLVNFENFYHHVASQFFIHWKPLIDNQLLAEAEA